MVLRRRLALLLSCLLVLALTPAAAVGAQPADDPGSPPLRDDRRGDVPFGREPDPGLRDPSAPPAELFAQPEATLQAQPDELRRFPVDLDDASIRLGLTPYHDIAPRLIELSEDERVTVEVRGQSVQGRDLYFVVVTAPETEEESARQLELRERMTADPAGTLADIESFAAEYKTPLYINNNIHGDEWEGTDASLELITDLLESDDPDVGELLERNVLVFNITANPDGRVAGTRRNANDFDLNRDFVTASQPETRVMRDAMIELNPLVLLDEHGYVNPTLIEPTTPPHNPNYEYDLYIQHALPQAETMAQAVIDLDITDVAAPEIPFRDWEEGWDDWPPIFTPMYAMYHGAVGHTIEFPLRVNRQEYTDQPEEELQRRSAINTEVARATIEGMFSYVLEHRDEMLADQVELYRRGAAGEPQPEIPDDFVPGWGPEDRYDGEYPRAYVIDAEASPTAAARLVDHLIANDIRVERAEDEFTAGGETFPAGSYVVDMHQPKRGLANTMLWPGRDISDRVSQMYDISGWSHALLWGASVDEIPRGTDLTLTSSPVDAAAPTGAAPDGTPAAYGFTVDDLAGVRVVNELLDRGISLERAEDGTVIVPAAARRAVEQLAATEGVRFSAVDALPAGRAPLDPVDIAAAVNTDEEYVLSQLGFEFTPVSTAALNDGFELDDYDVLMVSAGLAYDDLDEAARAEVDAFLADGGAMVARGATGAAFNEDADLLDVTTTTGWSAANGVVAVTNTSGSPIVREAPRQDHSFVYGPVWFSDPGPGVRVDQRFADHEVLVGGHWLPTGDPEDPDANAQEDAAGQATIVHGETSGGARVVLFGTDPLFRDHPRGLYRQAAEALWWAADTGTAVDLIAAACPPGQVPDVDFPDTPGSAHERAIGCLVWYGLAQGFEDGRYRPQLDVRRGQMATFVVNLLDYAGVDLPEPSDQGFTDIAGTTHEASINQLAELDIVSGQTATTFNPSGNVRRDQMATFIRGAYEEITGTELPPGDREFADVGPTNVHREAISALAAAGIVVGTGDDNYAPRAGVRRGQMASFLMRTANLLVLEEAITPPQ